LSLHPTNPASHLPLEISRLISRGCHLFNSVVHFETPPPAGTGPHDDTVRLVPGNPVARPGVIGPILDTLASMADKATRRP
jgi:hypothetical protein